MDQKDSGKGEIQGSGRPQNNGREDSGEEKGRQNGGGSGEAEARSNGGGSGEAGDRSNGGGSGEAGDRSNGGGSGEAGDRSNGGNGRMIQPPGRVTGAQRNIHKRNLIYNTLYPYVKRFFFHYYGRVEVKGIENIPRDAAVIFAPNHQNALMDALIVLFVAPGDVVFLARADIFSKKFLAFLLNSLKILPVFRQRDGSAELSKNQEIFDISVNLLKARHYLCIMPEGSHGDKRVLRPLVKGIFRIAFTAQEPHASLPFVKIVPVGLDFGHYVKQNQSLLINFGKPIEISDYWEQYGENSARAINELRTRLSDEMKPLMIHIPTEKYYDTIMDLRTIFNDRMREILGIEGNTLTDRFRADKEMIQRLERVIGEEPTGDNGPTGAQEPPAATDPATGSLDPTSAEEPPAATGPATGSLDSTAPSGPGSGKLATLAEKVDTYFQGVEKMRIRDWVVREGGYGFPRGLWRYLTLAITFPVFLYGFINNVLPYFLPVYFSRKIKDLQFHSSVKSGLGIAFFFPIFYLLQTLLVGLVTGPWWIWVAYLISLLPAGKVALYWYFRWKKTVRGTWFNRRLRRKDPGAGGLVRLRREIISLTEELVGRSPRS